MDQPKVSIKSKKFSVRNANIRPLFYEKKIPISSPYTHPKRKENDGI